MKGVQSKLKPILIGILFFVVILSNSNANLNFHIASNTKSPCEEHSPVNMDETASFKQLKEVQPEESPYKTNILENPSFEDPSPYPSGFSLDMSTLAYSNTSYQDNTHTGSFAGLLGTQGSSNTSSSRYLYPYFSRNPYLAEDVGLSAWFNIHNPGVVTDQNTVYFRVRLYSPTEGNHYIFYYLSYRDDYSPTNGSSYHYFLLNTSLNVWSEFQRDITQDYLEAWGVAPPDTYVAYVRFYVSSPQDASDIAELIMDDVSIYNGTMNLVNSNGDFEAGTGVGWSNLGYYSPSHWNYVDDSTAGQQAIYMNVTSREKNSDGYFSVNKYFDYPYGYYPESCAMEFDWKYEDILGGGTDQYAYMSLSASNSSQYYTFYNILGADHDIIPLSNASYDKVLVDAHFGQRGTWQHSTINISAMFRYFNLTNLFIHNIRFYLNQGEQLNSSATLYLDNLNFTTYPLGDPGFEEDFHWSTSYPLSSWEYSAEGYPTINLTNEEVHSGAFAAKTNITAGGNAHLFRDTFAKITEDIYTNFWTKMTVLEPVGEHYSYLELEFENAYHIRYILSSASHTFYNDSNNGHILTSQFNTTGDWFNITRNVYDDASEAFGFQPSWWNLTEARIVSYCDAGNFTMYADDMNFVKNTYGPSIRSVTVDSSPVYYDSTRISCHIRDRYGMVIQALIYYYIDDTWDSVSATRLSAYNFVGYIPSTDYGETVDFYITAKDRFGASTTDDNDGSYYTYLVGDDIAPDLTIINPLNKSTHQDTITLEVEAHDVGSGVNRVEFYMDDLLLYTDSIAPYEYDWDSRSVNNGSHILKAMCVDTVGNSKSEQLQIYIANDVQGPLISEIFLNPTIPTYDTPVQIGVAVTDSSSINDVTLFYKPDDGSWINTTLEASLNLYTGVIPQYPWYTEVSYYVTAYDAYDQPNSRGNVTHPLSYVVADKTDPILQINGPINKSVIMGTVNFSIMAQDAGSGLQSISVEVNGTQLMRETTSPQIFTWDTRQAEKLKGTYVITFIATDMAGNEFTVTYIYETANPSGLDAVFQDVGTFLQNYGFVTGGVTVVALWIVFKLVMRRRRRGGE